MRHLPVVLWIVAGSVVPPRQLLQALHLLTFEAQNPRTRAPQISQVVLHPGIAPVLHRYPPTARELPHARFGEHALVVPPPKVRDVDDTAVPSIAFRRDHLTSPVEHRLHLVWLEPRVEEQRHFVEHHLKINSD